MTVAGSGYYPWPQHERSCAVTCATMSVAEVRALFDSIDPDPGAAFPRLAAYLDGPFERCMRQTLRLVRLHAPAILAGNAPRLAGLCQRLVTLAERESSRGDAVRRKRMFTPRKLGIDRLSARDHARWFSYLIPRHRPCRSGGQGPGDRDSRSRARTGERTHSEHPLGGPATGAAAFAEHANRDCALVWGRATASLVP